MRVNRLHRKARRHRVAVIGARRVSTPQFEMASLQTLDNVPRGQVIAASVRCKSGPNDISPTTGNFLGTLWSSTIAIPGKASAIRTRFGMCKGCSPVCMRVMRLRRADADRRSSLKISVLFRSDYHSQVLDRASSSALVARRRTPRILAPDLQRQAFRRGA
jgi:hypothetical protein